MLRSTKGMYRYIYGGMEGSPEKSVYFENRLMISNFDLSSQILIYVMITQQHEQKVFQFLLTSMLYPYTQTHTQTDGTNSIRLYFHS